MNMSELVKTSEFKIGMLVLGLIVVISILMTLLRKKDGFCRCNSLGSRVLCDEEHEKLKQLEGAL